MEPSPRVLWPFACVALLAAPATASATTIVQPTLVVEEIGENGAPGEDGESVVAEGVEISESAALVDVQVSVPASLVADNVFESLDVGVLVHASSAAGHQNGALGHASSGA